MWASNIHSIQFGHLSSGGIERELKLTFAHLYVCIVLSESLFQVGEFLVSFLELVVH